MSIGNLTFETSLDPDQAQHIVGTDLGPICNTLMVFLKDNMYFEKVDLKKICQRQKFKITLCTKTALLNMALSLFQA